MRKKGFTLIELLAVIVILAVIALIVTPTIFKILENAKEAANKRTVNGIIKGADLYYTESLMDASIARKFDGFTNVFNEIEERLNHKLNEKGNLYIDKDGNVGVSIVLDGKCYKKEFQSSDISSSDDKENCFLTNEIKSSYAIFGGIYLDNFRQVIKTKDGGYLAIGDTNSPKVETLSSHGTKINYDGIVVKFDQEGRQQWYQNYGREGHDYFYATLEEEDGYLIAAKVDNLDDRSNVVVVKYSKEGKKIEEKTLMTSKELYYIDLLKKENNYYLIVTGRGIDPKESSAIMLNVIKYNSNFEQEYVKGYTERYMDRAEKAIINSSGNMILVGMADGNLGFLEGIDKKGSGFLLEIKPDTGDILSITTEDTFTFTNVVETTDGYIAVGWNGMEAERDATIMKYGKIKESSGNLPLLWSKTFRGSSSEAFQAVAVQEDEIVVVGSSQSKDQDMKDLNPDGIITGILIKYDQRGNLLEKRKIGGSKGENIQDIIPIADGYIIVGYSFSSDGDMFPYRYGNSDAFLMKIDKNLNPLKDFNSQIFLADSVKTLIKNYGTHIPSVEGAETLKLYTTNDPTKDLGKWCTSRLTIDPNSNYQSVVCLKPFNEGDSISHYYQTLKENHHKIDTISSDNWIFLDFYYGNAGGIELSNMKLKFEGSDYVTFQEAVDLKYIEPLVLIGRDAIEQFSFSNSYNLLSGGSSGMGFFPGIVIKFKPKIKLTDFIYNSSKDTDLTQGHFGISEYRNFDISLTKTN